MENLSCENTPYTIFAHISCGGVTLMQQLLTGKDKPRHYIFRSLEEAKKALEHPILEGELSLDKMSKSFWDEYEGEDGARVTYKIEEVRVLPNVDFYTDYHKLP